MIHPKDEGYLIKFRSLAKQLPSRFQLVEISKVQEVETLVDPAKPPEPVKATPAEKVDAVSPGKHVPEDKPRRRRGRPKK
ncbi:MAG: hypothetical protein HKN48_00035 [Flavobacteriaceae bacterium]|nr:hypothetical protein [Flavobacteriaceae bacterium]